MGRFDKSVAAWMLLVAIVCLSANVSGQSDCEPSCKPRQAPMPDKQVRDKQAAVEAGLMPAIVFDDAPQPHWSITERMSRYHVPGVAIAVIADGRLAWSAGYGVCKAGETGAVSSQTLFQATSISKPVAAATALALVQQRRLSLDAGVNAQLHGWKIPASDQGDSDAVTLRELLSHTSGLGLHGFAGYAADTPLPTLVQILAGKAPANSPPVVLVQAPGAGYRYSGGGYQVMQLLAEEVAGQPFAELADRRVLQPLAMRRSAFSATLPRRFADDVAVGHGFDGQAIAGGWHRYPELAAAGLWTTSTDLARLVIAVMDAWREKPQSTLVPGIAPALTPALARQMLTPTVDGMGLGFGVHGEGDALYFDHSGANSGYQAYLVAYPVRGEGLVVMTNGDGGGNLAAEISRSVARIYGWPDFAPRSMTAMPATVAELDARVGDYAVDKYGFAITVRRSGKALIVSTPRGSRYTFRRTGPDEFTALEDASTVHFDTGHAGQLQVWGMTAHKLPRQ